MKLKSRALSLVETHEHFAFRDITHVTQYAMISNF